jgi:hypothetical protein
MQQPQRIAILRCRSSGEFYQVVISLVDQDEIGQFHDAALDALQFIARAGKQQQHEHIGHVGHLGFGLSDAHGLDNDDVEPGCLAKNHRLAATPGDAAQRSAGRRRPYESIVTTGQLFHARLISQDRTAADRRRGIHGEHGDAVTSINHVIAERFDKG